MSKPLGTNLRAKDANYFPSLGSALTLESWIQIGTTKYPNNTYGIGTRAHQMRYQKALGQLTSGLQTSSNSLLSYNDDSMIIVFDLERLGGGGVAMSGMNTHGGNMTINLKGLGQVAPANFADRIDCIIWHDNLLSIRDGACSVSF